ncbi:PglL family O-oligosaccharyltransferase [Serratia bockelmannii]|uniref:PglL family O-oligosaccharyltransferase n=1 Tax=Serratia bockelmannii TaxID=2703793 RepID=UPI00235EAB85|nr:O-antigen ligase family protein [Serratia bockelmannii]
MYSPYNTYSFRARMGLVIVPSGLLLIWLLILLPLYLPNMGGSGLALPQNSLTWTIMATVVATIWLTLPAGDRLRLRVTVTAQGTLLSILILAIPLYYTAPQWHEAALIRWLALLGGWVFYFSLLQYPLSRVGRHVLYYAILTATVLQALIALLQFIVPACVPVWLAYPVNGSRVYGVFQQPNVLASFMATGLALALMLFLLPTFACRHPLCERLRVTGLGGILVLFGVMLVWVQSRVGWVGGAVVALALLCRFYPVAPRRTVWAAGLLAVGLLMGCFTLFQELSMEGSLRHDHVSSNHARYTMLHDTLAMIGQKFLLGWGYGGFEYSFQHFRLMQGLSTQGVGIARHPHNELLLWWVEGGLTGLLGMLLLLACGLRLVMTALRGDSAKKSRFTRPTGEATALCLVLLPILLHTQTEYPFTLSAAHWAIVLLLLALLDRQAEPLSARMPVSLATAGVLRAALPALAIPLALMTGIGLYGNLTLTPLERHHLVTLEPARRVMAFDLWVNRERWQYDSQTHALLTFNHTRDSRLLDGYVRWARTYLSRRIDKNVYAAWIAIAQFRQDPLTYRRLLQEAHTLFPENTRFILQDSRLQQKVAI